MSETHSQNPVVERVHLLVAPIVADLGLEFYDLEFVGGVLKIAPIRRFQDQGVSLGPCLDYPSGLASSIIPIRCRAATLEVWPDLSAHDYLVIFNVSRQNHRAALAPEPHRERRISSIVSADNRAVTVRTDDVANTDVVAPYQLTIVPHSF